MTTEADMIRAREELEKLNNMWRLVITEDEQRFRDRRTALAVVGLGLLVFWGAVIWGLLR